MSTEKTIARGVRLPESVWERLDVDAEGLGMTTNEYIRRRLRMPSAGQKTPDAGQKSPSVPDLVEVE